MRGARRGAESTPHGLIADVGSPLLATACGLALLWLHPSAAGLGISIAAAVCAACAASSLHAARSRTELDAARQRVESGLGALAPRTAEDAGRRLRPGEELVLEAGDRSPVDVIVRAGEADVEPWFGAPYTVHRQEGDGIIAGARIVRGAVRSVVRWSGTDRAWARLTTDPQRRADRHASHARLAAQLTTLGAALAAAAAALIAFSAREHPLLILSYAAAGFAALSNVGLRDRVGALIAEGVYASLFQGIIIKTPSAFDRAGRVSFVVFCAQGTLLRGEYNVASIEPTKDMDADELLSLAAGAYAGTPSPISAALSRSAQAHDVRPDASRSHNYRPGLGVTAVASSGRPVVVGSRALLLECRVSVATAENRIAELEAVGREVLLVAFDGRWIGLIALQDTPHGGARGAVQRLLDAGVEPVLLSGDARETCKALARHIGIDHVRPEVLPDERAREINRLSQTGTLAAVVGRGSSDDAALAAASLSINIEPSGGPLERWDIEAVSSDVRDAAAAIAIARQTYERTRMALLMAVGLALLALLLIALGAPAWLAPLPSLAGVVLTRRQ